MQFRPSRPFSIAYLAKKDNNRQISSEEKEHSGKVQTLIGLNNSYSRKRGAVQFNYVSTNSSVKYEKDSPFAVILQKLPQLFQSISSSSKSYTAFAEVLCMITTLNRISNERISRLYSPNSRDEGVNVLYINISFLYYELFQYKSTLTQIASQFETMLTSMNSLRQLITFTTSQYIPSLIVRVKRILTIVIAKISGSNLHHYFKQTHNSQFLEYYSEQIHKQHSNGSSGVIGCGCTSNKAVVTSSSGTKASVEDPINSAMSQAIQQYIAIIIDINTICCGSSGEVGSIDLLSDYLTIILNSTLQSLLTELIHSKQLMDEFGIYKLYRIILKYQEYIVLLKRQCLSTNTGSTSLEVAGSTRSASVRSSNVMLIQDLTVWRKAEFILELLNKSIFARKQPVNNLVNSTNGNGDSLPYNFMRSFRAAPPSTTVFNINTLAIHNDHISMEEQQQWITLTDNEFTKPSTSVLFSWMSGAKNSRWKHKGTVNIALTIPTSDL